MPECPMNDWECPYFNIDSGVCTINNPDEECDAFYDCDDEDFDEEGYILTWGGE